MIHARDHYERFAVNVGALTAQDLGQAARRHVDPDHLRVVIVGDRATVEGPRPPGTSTPDAHRQRPAPSLTSTGP
jgi:hypothetical protein